MLKNITGIWLNNMFSNVLSILLIPLIISKLGAHVYGEFVLLQVLGVDGVFSFLELGVTSVLVKMVSKIEYESTPTDTSGYKYQEIYSSAVIIFGVALLIILLFFYLFNDFVIIKAMGIDSLDSQLKSLSWYYVFSFALWLFSSIFSGMLQGKKCFTVLRSLESIASLFQLGISAIIVYYANADQLKMLSIVYLLSYVLRFFAYVYLFKKHFEVSLLKVIPSMGTIKEIFMTARMFIVGRISGVLINSVSKIILSNLAGLVLLGIYDLTIKISKILKNIFSAVSSVLLPESFKILSENKHYESVRCYSKLVYISTLLSIFFFCSCGFLIEGKIKVDISYSTFVMFVIVEFIFMVLTQYTLIPSNFYIVVNSKLSLLTKGAIVNSVAFVGTVFFLTSHFSVYGMYLAKIIGALSASIYFSSNYSKDFDFSLYEFLKMGKYYILLMLLSAGCLYLDTNIRIMGLIVIFLVTLPIVTKDTKYLLLFAKTSKN